MEFVLRFLFSLFYHVGGVDQGIPLCYGSLERGAFNCPVIIRLQYLQVRFAGSGPRHMGWNFLS